MDENPGMTEERAYITSSCPPQMLEDIWGGLGGAGEQHESK